MESNFINIILKAKTNNFDLNSNETLNLFKASLGNNENNFNYPCTSEEKIRDCKLIKLYNKKKMVRTKFSNYLL